MILAIAVALLASCSSRQTAATLDDVESFIQARPDSALSTLRALDTATLTTSRLRAHYALLYAMALDKNWIDTTNVGVVMPAVTYYDRHPSNIDRAKAWYYLGRIQQNDGDLPDASISFLKSERYLEPFNDVPFKALVKLAISTVYSQSHFHEEALKYSEQAHALFVEVNDSLNANAALFGIAQEYHSLGRNGEADSLYCFVLENSIIHPNVRSELLCSYALSCVNHGQDYEHTVQLFDSAIAIKGSLGKRNYWGAYAYALLRTGNTRKAGRIFNQLALVNNSSQEYVYDYWKSMADAYEGDYPSAYRLQKEASTIQTENVNKAFKNSAIAAQRDFLEEMYQEAEKSSRIRQTVAWSSVAIMLVLILALSILFKHRKERSAQEREVLLDAYKSLTMEHSALTSRFADLNAQVDRIENDKASVRNKYIQLCQTHFSRIGRITEVLHYHSKGRDDNLYHELKKAIQNIGLDNKNQSEFEKWFIRRMDR